MWYLLLWMPEAAKCIDGKEKHKMQNITKYLDKLMTLDHSKLHQNVVMDIVMFLNILWIQTS